MGRTGRFEIPGSAGVSGGSPRIRWRGGAIAVAVALTLGLASAELAGSPPLGGGAPDDPISSAVPMDGDVVLITGSTSGLGREVAHRIAALGAHVIVHGRSEESGMEVVREIEAEGGSASFLRADLASLDEVRALAAAVLEGYDRLDFLINNAGIGSAGGGRQESRDGYEMVFQVNYLSHFVLTELLLPRLLESAPARIVNVASSAQTPIRWEDVMLEEPGAIGRAYGQSKLAQILHALDLHERLEGTGVLVNAVHPATFMDTRMVQQAGIEPQSTVEEGADSVMQLVVDPVGSGRYFNRLEPAEANAQAYDASERDRLRSLSLELVGLPADPD